MRPESSHNNPLLAQERSVGSPDFHAPFGSAQGTDRLAAESTVAGGWTRAYGEADVLYEAVAMVPTMTYADVLGHGDAGVEGEAPRGRGVGWRDTLPFRASG